MGGTENKIHYIKSTREIITELQSLFDGYIREIINRRNINGGLEFVRKTRRDYMNNKFVLLQQNEKC